MNHSTSKRSAKALPQVESTMLIEGPDAKIIKCKARKAFTVGNASVKEGETFFLVRSERRVGRYYVVHFSEDRNTYQCSCGANCCEHEHLKTTREYVMSHVVVPAAESSKVTPMTVPATSAEIRAKRQAAKVETHEQFDGSMPLTADKWKAIMKRDRAQQKALRAEYQAKLEEARKQDLAG